MSGRRRRRPWKSLYRAGRSQHINCFIKLAFDNQKKKKKKEGEKGGRKEGRKKEEKFMVIFKCLLFIFCNQTPKLKNLIYLGANLFHISGFFHIKH